MSELLSVKELAAVLKKSEMFVYYMRWTGFEMPGGVAKLSDALEFLKRHPNPCSEFRRKKSGRL